MPVNGKTSFHRMGKTTCHFQEIQMDASEHLWFGNSKSQLHLSIDDATGRIVGGHFDRQETLCGYFSVLKQILTVH